MNTTASFEVFFVNDATGWACVEHDDEGNQIGDADFNFHKRDALKAARASAGACFPIKVFGKDGELQRTINAATA